MEKKASRVVGGARATSATQIEGGHFPSRDIARRVMHETRRYCVANFIARKVLIWFSFHIRL